MEKVVEKSVDDTFRMPGIAGVLCADEHGLCLASKGIANKTQAGYIVNLVKQASQLHPNAGDPVVCLEAEGGSILMKNESNVTTAVFKSPTS